MRRHRERSATSMTKYFNALFLLAIFALSQIDINAAPKTDARPNIVLILADDMGYRDPGCYGGTLAPTPSIDRLAREGVRFTDGYVTASECAPSRCGLLSVAYNQRFGMQWNEDQHPRH